MRCFQFRRGEGDFHFWVMAVFRNKVRDFVRRQALTRGLMEYFDEQRSEDDETASPAEREVVKTIVRRYEDLLQNGDTEDGAAAGGEAFGRVAEALERLEPWERVLLRCRALDVPYEEISGYTGKSVQQLKVYHARVRKKFFRVFNTVSEELASQ